MNLYKKSVSLIILLTRRNVSKTPDVEIKVHSGFAKLKETQKKFEVEDGVPVYLKEGTKDQVLYRLTWIVTFVGLGMSGETFYQLMMKDQQADNTIIANMVTEDTVFDEE